MWRATHDQRYRNWAQQLAQSIQTHCYCAESGGYSLIGDVNQLPAQKLDRQPIFLLSATFKYLYLIFSDDEEHLPADEWVFNWAGQPLPIRGRNVRFS